MPSGTPVNRHFVIVLQDGRVVIDWGNSQYQDICTGEFVVTSETVLGRPVQPDELETLCRNGFIDHFDEFNVFMKPLPEQERPALE